MSLQIYLRLATFCTCFLLQVLSFAPYFHIPNQNYSPLQIFFRSNDPSLYLATKNQETKERSVELILEEGKYGEPFTRKIRELQGYKNAHGHCLVPKRYESNPTLGNWVNKQRQNYKKFTKGQSSPLTADKIRILDEIGFVWVANSTQMRLHRSDPIWLENFEQLKSYHAKNGNCRVPSNTKLGSWVAKQRAEREKIQESGTSEEKIRFGALSQKRIDMLNELNFEWLPPRIERWNTRLEQLRDYKAKHGDCLVPIAYQENPSLAQWVSSQRKMYKDVKKGKKVLSNLVIYRIRELHKIGFVWDYWEHEYDLFLKKDGTNKKKA